MSDEEAFWVEVGMRLVPLPDGEALPVHARFWYDPSKPYAMTIAFLHSDEQVMWTFSRDLLAQGLDEPAGFGDVRIWPWSTPRGDYLALALTSPDGEALFELRRTDAARFLRRSYALVPRGRESDYLDIDKAIEEILDGRYKSDT